MKRWLLAILGLALAGAVLGFLVRLLWPRRLGGSVSRTAELRARS